MGDGSFAYHPECEAKRLEVLAEYPYRCPRTDWHVPISPNALPRRQRPLKLRARRPPVRLTPCRA